jgi:hypothetical protein
MLPRGESRIQYHRMAVVNGLRVSRPASCEGLLEHEAISKSEAQSRPRF